MNRLFFLLFLLFSGSMQDGIDPMHFFYPVSTEAEAKEGRLQCLKGVCLTNIGCITCIAFNAGATFNDPADYSKCVPAYDYTVCIRRYRVVPQP